MQIKTEWNGLQISWTNFYFLQLKNRKQKLHKLQHFNILLSNEKH